MSPRDAARVFVVGSNHRSGTALLRDRLFVDEAMLPHALERLRAAGIEQALILSTCDRTEIQAVGAAAESAAALVRGAFASIGNVGPEEIGEQSYTLFDDAALRHIFAVASSLDSQVIGEPQVLGQVRASHRISSECGMVGPELDAILQAAYGVAKRVRSETEIARQPVSIASVAARIAQDLHGDLADCSALVVGLGEIGELIHEQLRLAGLRDSTLTGPMARTEAAARRAGLHYAPFEELAGALAKADIVVSAAGTGRWIVNRELVEEALKARRRKPILLLDVAVPADVDRDVEGADGAFLYAFDDLERVALEGRSRRQEAAADAWRIVDEALDDWRRRAAEKGAIPAVVALRGYFDAAREQVLADHPGADAAQATRLLVNRLLHRPLTAMRDIVSAGDERSLADAGRLEALIRHLFGGPSDKERD
ncbi:MAG: glutamyl-tRNA reductase [Alphaproteobacteria bacterium]|nr:glutamyl-tRNA reductase [Alphaproteobacteria bacterium]